MKKIEQILSVIILMESIGMCLPDMLAAHAYQRKLEIHHDHFLQDFTSESLFQLGIHFSRSGSVAIEA